MDTFFNQIGAVANMYAPLAAAATLALWAAIAIVVAAFAGWGFAKLARNARERRLADFRLQPTPRMRGITAQRNNKQASFHGVPAE